MIKVNNLSFEIEEKKILNDINLNIKEGKIFGIIGPNGVGKTTLLRCLSGIYQATSCLLYTSAINAKKNITTAIDLDKGNIIFIKVC